MTRKTVEFYFDFGSPAAYLAWAQLPALCDEAGAELIHKPMLLGAVFQATGNRSPAEVPAKSRYVRRDQLASQLAKAPTADYEPQGQTSDGCHAADLFGGNTPIPKAAKPT